MEHWLFCSFQLVSTRAIEEAEQVVKIGKRHFSDKPFCMISLTAFGIGVFGSLDFQ